MHEFRVSPDSHSIIISDSNYILQLHNYIIEISELCVIMQAKQSVKDSAEKEDIVKDVRDAYHKSIEPVDDNRRLIFVVSINKDAKV